MKKNTASQKIGVQMVSATDGSAFTGAVTIAVTGDAGTQATGSVGAGACTHEGNGYHTYAPAQAETNYDLIAFTFTGSGAVPATVQVFTSFDANLITWLGTAPLALTSQRVQVYVGVLAANAIDAASVAADAGVEFAAAVWDRLTSALSVANSIGKLLVDNINATISSRASQTSVDTVDDLLDTELAAVKTVVDAVKAKTDSLTFTVAGQVDSNIQTVNDVAIQGTGAAGDLWRKV